MARSTKLDPGRHDALAVVKTPLQLLNALEARYAFEFRAPALYLLTSPHNTPRDLLALVDPHDWGAVRCLNYGHIWTAFGMPWLQGSRFANSERGRILGQSLLRWDFDRVFESWRGVPHLLVGNYMQTLFKHLAFLCQPSRAIALDDGTDTLRIATARQRWFRGDDQKTVTPAPWTQPKRWWVSNRVAWKGVESPALTFFTTYDIDVPRCDIIVRNTYRHLQARVEARQTNGRCYFLGQPLVEDGYVSADSHRQLLQQVLRSFGEREVIYVPHPREQVALLKARLADVGMPMRPLGKPLEFHLLDTDTLPAVIASFFCSALDNCRLIWDKRMRLVSFRIDPAQLLVCQDFVADIYRYFADKTGGAVEIYEPGQRI